MNGVAQAHGARARRGLPPGVILLCGLLAAAACLLLLFGPFYPPRMSPGETVRLWFLLLLDGNGPYLLTRVLWERFFLVSAALLVLVLAVLPWRAARKAQRGHRGAGRTGAVPTREGPTSRTTRKTRTVLSSSVSFSDDGRLLDEQNQGTGEIQRSIPQLRMMARAAGIPWHTDFETEGGARGFLEILRALQTGQVQVHRAEHSTPAAEESGHAAKDRTGGYRPSTTSWSSSTSGPVYTPTSLYSSERMPGQARPDEDEEGRR